MGGLLTLAGAFSGAGNAAKDSLLQSQKDDVTRSLETSRQTFENLRQEKNLAAQSTLADKQIASTEKQGDLTRQFQGTLSDKQLAAAKDNLGTQIAANAANLGIQVESAQTIAALQNATQKEIHAASNLTSIQVAKLTRDSNEKIAALHVKAATVKANSDEARVLQQEMQSERSQLTMLQIPLLDMMKNNPDSPETQNAKAMIQSGTMRLKQMESELNAKLNITTPAPAMPTPTKLNLGPYSAPQSVTGGSASPMTPPSNQGYTPIPSVLNQ